MRPDRFRAYAPEGYVVHEGSVPAKGKVTFETDGFVERVVFYAGEPDEEVVAGEIDVRRTGSIEFDPELPDPE